MNLSGFLLKIKTMHYNYKALELAFELLDAKWASLCPNDTFYFDKCRLVGRQIIGYLQRTLPAIDQIGFARAFHGKERSLNFGCSNGRFPDRDNMGGGMG